MENLQNIQINRDGEFSLQRIHKPGGPELDFFYHVLIPSLECP